jgi:hypothetical protein
MAAGNAQLRPQGATAVHRLASGGVIAAARDLDNPANLSALTMFIFSSIKI